MSPRIERLLAELRVDQDNLAEIAEQHQARLDEQAAAWERIDAAHARIEAAQAAVTEQLAFNEQNLRLLGGQVGELIVDYVKHKNEHPS